MEQYLIDSNIISGYLSGLYSEKAMGIVADAIDNNPIISVITQIEALSWVSNNKIKEVIIKSFISDSKIISLDKKIIDECIRLRRSRKIKTPDAIIAASAIVYNYTLISTDEVFKKISALKLINPKNI